MSKLTGDSNVQITVTGSGTNVWVYAINDETYDKIKALDDSFDAKDVILDEYSAGQLICWGLDVSGNSNIKINIGGKEKELKIINTYDGYSLEETLKDKSVASSTAHIEFNTDEKEPLGADFDLSNINHIFLDAVTWKDMTLQMTLPVTAKNFDIKKLKLLACDLDSEFELAEATYQMDLLDGQEEDIIGVNYDGTKYFFACSDSHRSIHQTRSLVSRSDDGWEINEDIDLSR